MSREEKVAPRSSIGKGDRVRWRSSRVDMGIGTVERVRQLISVRWDGQHLAVEYDSDDLELYRAASRSDKAVECEHDPRCVHGDAHILRSTAESRDAGEVRTHAEFLDELYRLADVHLSMLGDAERAPFLISIGKLARPFTTGARPANPKTSGPGVLAPVHTTTPARGPEEAGAFSAKPTVTEDLVRERVERVLVQHDLAPRGTDAQLWRDLVAVIPWTETPEPDVRLLAVLAQRDRFRRLLGDVWGALGSQDGLVSRVRAAFDERPQGSDACVVLPGADACGCCIRGTSGCAIYHYAEDVMTDEKGTSR